MQVGRRVMKRQFHFQEGVHRVESDNNQLQEQEQWQEQWQWQWQKQHALHVVHALHAPVDRHFVLSQMDFDWPPR